MVKHDFPKISDLEKVEITDFSAKEYAALLPSVQRLGAVAVTHQGQVEVVVMSVEAYERLTGTARGLRSDVAMAKLTARFDKFVADLNTGDSLARVIKSPPERGAKIRIGKSL